MTENVIPALIQECRGTHARILPVRRLKHASAPANNPGDMCSLDHDIPGNNISMSEALRGTQLMRDKGS